MNFPDRFFESLKAVRFPGYFKRQVKTTLLSIVILAVLQFPHVSRGATVDRVLATVGEEVITISDYRQFVKGIGEIPLADEIDEDILKRFIEEKIIIHEARKKGIEADEADIDLAIEEFKAMNGLSDEDLTVFLQEENISMKDYRKILKDRLVISRLVSLEVDSKVIIEEKEMEDFYQTHKKDFLSTPETLRIHAIFLRLNNDATVTEITDLKRKALKIASLLNEGYSFDMLVEEYSDEPLKSQDGLLGTFVRGSLVAPLDETAFALKEGEVSEPVWVSEGAYILKLKERTPEKFRQYKEVRGELRNALYEQKREQMFNFWLKTLWEKSSVSVK